LEEEERRKRKRKQSKKREKEISFFVSIFNITSLLVIEI